MSNAVKRKFLRQNSILAKTNSVQSLQIRQLELDRARLLSENLGLRGTVIELETRLREQTAEKERIASHALDIKARLEAQLVSWGEMLASLGDEPPPLRPSPRARKVSKTARTSLGSSGSGMNSRRLSPSHAQWMEKWKQIEMSPILEHKVLPRPTIGYGKMHLSFPLTPANQRLLQRSPGQLRLATVLAGG